ncbi:TDT family transporter [Actinomycetospora sp. NBRC 106378]|uniref:TDT family transporter n=1 Tax=Actinomycetospora sp. NBRC 106378 TaxID=3032208 RepID=UPI0024A3F4F0|nr:TDT family transporter [Actinomycetospora sp. NBRC 106378]GLZ54090.1 C4-dicarboxylate ABC transporter [Actinomycetospora sp. NBRC 106378]
MTDTQAAPDHRRLLLRDLEQPRDLFANIGPNWYASVMGTGIVGGAAATLPIQFPGLRGWGTAIWGLATVWLVVLTAAWAVHWVRHTERAKGHATNPTMAQFWGAPAMGLMTIGLGFAQFGPSLIGATTALAASWVLWSLGTALGLFTTAWIPYMMITRHEIGQHHAFGGWLMPVVPPMVSAANGSLLIGHLPPGAGRETMLLACYAMFGVSLFATLAILPQIWNRLVVHGEGAASAVPTMWIVLGPLGQSVTATNLLANQARGTLGEPYASGAEVFGLFYGFATWGFAMIWIALAAAVTIRTVRRKMPFALTSWWSFTFPVGTCVTGTSALAARTHVPALAWWAMGLYALLVAAWLVVAVRTAHRSVVRGDILAPA